MGAEGRWSVWHSTMPAEEPSLPRLFVACAPQDAKFSELIGAKARADRLPLVLAGFGEGRVDEIGWQLECRRRIRSARALVVLISPHTSGSPRALWQVRCARELGLPVVGITVSFEDEIEGGRGEVVGMESIVGWKWKTIAAMLMRFATVSAPKIDRAEGEVSPARGHASRGSAA